MPIEAQFKENALEEYIHRCHELAMDYIFEAFANLAEQCVNRIRDRSAKESWVDHTGNLRSSIGYIITINGQPAVSGGFKPTNARQGNGEQGQKRGPEYANEILSAYSSKPIALVVVAGMEYAVSVEAMSNKDVLAATELWARGEWAKREPELRETIENAWEKLAKQMNIV